MLLISFHILNIVEYFETCPQTLQGEWWSGKAAVPCCFGRARGQVVLLSIAIANKLLFSDILATRRGMSRRWNLKILKYKEQLFSVYFLSDPSSIIVCPCKKLFLVDLINMTPAVEDAIQKLVDVDTEERIDDRLVTAENLAIQGDPKRLWIVNLV